MDPQLDMRLADAAEQLARIRRDAWAGAPKGTSLLGLLRLTSDLHTYVLEQAAQQIRKDPRP